MNSIGDKNHQSYTKIKRRKTKKIDKNFILDEPEETLNAKNQLFQFSENHEGQQIYQREHKYSISQRNTPAEKDKKFTSWYDESFKTKNRQKQLNKRETWKGVSFQNIKLSRTQIKSACDIGNNRTIDRVYEAVNNHSLNKSNKMKTIYTKKQIQSNIVTLAPYIDKKALTHSFNMKRVYKKEPTFLKANLSQKKKRIDAKLESSYEDSKIQRSLKVQESMQSTNFKTLSGNCLKNKKKKGKWIYPKNSNLRVSRVYQLEDSPLQKQFDSIVNLLEKQKLMG